jgi:hypothetical protein
MDLFLAGDCIAAKRQPRVEFIVSFRSFGRRWNELWFARAISKIQVYTMHDDTFQVTYHPRGKRLVSQNPISQSAKSEVARKPHQRVKM